ncbi:hypothetical protein Micbo1qcDRAFT_168478, partial [Microdochium bolleyi]
MINKALKPTDMAVAAWNANNQAPTRPNTAAIRGDVSTCFNLATAQILCALINVAGHFAAASTWPPHGYQFLIFIFATLISCMCGLFMLMTLPDLSSKMTGRLVVGLLGMLFGSGLILAVGAGFDAVLVWGPL